MMPEGDVVDCALPGILRYFDKMARTAPHCVARRLFGLPR